MIKREPSGRRQRLPHSVFLEIEKGSPNTYPQSVNEAIGNRLDRAAAVLGKTFYDR